MRGAQSVAVDNCADRCRFIAHSAPLKGNTSWRERRFSLSTHHEIERRATTEQETDDAASPHVAFNRHQFKMFGSQLRCEFPEQEGREAMNGIKVCIKD